MAQTCTLAACSSVSVTVNLIDANICFNRFVLYEALFHCCSADGAYKRKSSLMLKLSGPPFLRPAVVPDVSRGSLNRRLCNAAFTARRLFGAPVLLRGACREPAAINHRTGATALSGPIHRSAFSTRAGSGMLGMKRGKEENNFPSSLTLNPSAGAGDQMN